MANELTDAIRGIPPVTRFLIGSFLAVNLSVYILPSYIAYYGVSWDIFSKFHIWRLFTGTFFLGGPSFHFIMKLIFLYMYSSMLERNNFAGRRADFAFCLTFLWALSMVVALLLNLPLLGYMFVPAILYVWSQLNRETMVTFYFGFRFKAVFLPAAYLVFDVLAGVNPIIIMLTLVGNAIGHAYYYLEYIRPNFTGRRYLQTPQVFHTYFGEPQLRDPRTTSGDGATQAGGYRWGRGQRLGAD